MNVEHTAPTHRRRVPVNRICIYAVLLLFALYFLVPLYVMISNSLKNLDDLRAGNMLSMPLHPGFAAWQKAWSGACTGVRCDGMQPFFLNSLRMAIPAVLISSIVGALNG
jgi:glucose/mannose transport system permease protein